MKLISIFLLFSMFLYSSDALSLPKCIKYESMQKVIENDWSYASKRLKKFMEHNATTYVDTFMKLVDKPLVLKTDEEYIEEQLKKHQEILENKKLRESYPQPLESMTEYSTRIKKEVKYKIYYFKKYKKMIGSTEFNIMYVYIRYLEDKGDFKQTFLIYKKIAQYFLMLYQVDNKDFIHVTIYNYMIENYIKSLKMSLDYASYTKDDRVILYHLFKQFLVDENLFSKMLLEEKNTVFRYLDMYYLDKDTSIDYIINDKIFFKGLMKIIHEKNLKTHLHDKKTIKFFVIKYKKEIEKIYTKVLQLKNKVEYKKYAEEKDELTSYLSYSEMGRLWLLYLSDKIESDNISNILKFNFSSDEFIEFLNKSYLYFNKPWIWGKWKFEIEENIQKNKKFLELLEKD